MYQLWSLQNDDENEDSEKFDFNISLICMREIKNNILYLIFF